eukprot:9520002-Ditylum_brightwellii.AAC.1
MIAALKKSTNSNLRGAMDKETLDKQIHDASTQGRAVVNDVVPTEVITINDSKQDDDDDSLQTVSNLSLLRESFEDVEVGQFHNQAYLKHFFKILPNPNDCPPVPKKK